MIYRCTNCKSEYTVRYDICPKCKMGYCEVIKKDKKKRAPVGLWFFTAGILVIICFIVFNLWNPFDPVKKEEQYEKETSMSDFMIRYWRAKDFDWINIDEKAKTVKISFDTNTKDDDMKEINDIIHDMNNRYGLPNNLGKKLVDTSEFEGNKSEKAPGIKVTWSINQDFKNDIRKTIIIYEFYK